MLWGFFSFKFMLIITNYALQILVLNIRIIKVSKNKNYKNRSIVMAGYGGSLGKLCEAVDVANRFLKQARPGEQAYVEECKNLFETVHAAAAEAEGMDPALCAEVNKVVMGLFSGMDDMSSMLDGMKDDDIRGHIERVALYASSDVAQGNIRKVLIYVSRKSRLSDQEIKTIASSIHLEPDFAVQRQECTTSPGVCNSVESGSQQAIVYVGSLGPLRAVVDQANKFLTQFVPGDYRYVELCKDWFERVDVEASKAVEAPDPMLRAEVNKAVTNLLSGMGDMSIVLDVMSESDISEFLHRVVLYTSSRADEENIIKFIMSAKRKGKLSDEEIQLIQATALSKGVEVDFTSKLNQACVPSAALCSGGVVSVSQQQTVAEDEMSEAATNLAREMQDMRVVLQEGGNVLAAVNMFQVVLDSAGRLLKDNELYLVEEAQTLITSILDGIEVGGSLVPTKDETQSGSGEILSRLRSWLCSIPNRLRNT